MKGICENRSPKCHLPNFSILTALVMKNYFHQYEVQRFNFFINVKFDIEIKFRSN